MRRFYFALVGASMLTACGQKKPEQASVVDTTSRDIKLTTPDSTVAINDVAAPPTSKVDTVYLPQNTPPTRVRPRRRRDEPDYRPQPSMPPSNPPSPSPEPVPPPPAREVRSVSAGSSIVARSTRALSSRTTKAGETFTATVDEAVTSNSGRVVIPAGSEVTFTIDVLKPAKNKSDKDGTINIRATSVMVNGQSVPIDADVTYIEHTLKGRGIGTSEAAKVGVGAAAGAIIGKVLGGGGGAVAGGVVGGAAGAAVAVETADRDVIIPVGAKIKLALRSDFAIN